MNMLDKSVVRIKTNSGSGSGAVVSTNVVLTNEHVIDDAGWVQVGSKHIGNYLNARIVWHSPDLDLAILQVDGLTLPSVKLATRKPSKGEGVWAIGFPGAAITSSESTVNRGVVSLIATERRSWGLEGGVDMEIIQHDASINPGNSGGPLFDHCGRQVGVNSAGADSSQGLLLAVRITEAIPHLESRGISLQKVDTVCTTSSEVTGLEEALQEAQETVRQAQEQVEDAQAQVGVAQAQASVAQQEAEQAVRISIITGVVIGALALLALCFALRKPRQQIIHAMGTLSRPVRDHLPVMNLFNLIGGGKQVALVLTGFDAIGNKLRITVPEGASADEGGYVIGRHAALVDYAVEDASISRRHLRIIMENGQCRVEDINSTNGTCVNGTSLQSFSPHPIAQGDTILLGTVELRVSR